MTAEMLDLPRRMRKKNLIINDNHGINYFSISREDVVKSTVSLVWQTTAIFLQKNALISKACIGQCGSKALGKSAIFDPSFFVGKCPKRGKTQGEVELRELALRPCELRRAMLLLGMRFIT